LKSILFLIISKVFIHIAKSVCPVDTAPSYPSKIQSRLQSHYGYKIR
jgi:hypothetical protein